MIDKLYTVRSFNLRGTFDLNLLSYAKSRRPTIGEIISNI